MDANLELKQLNSTNTSDNTQKKLNKKFRQQVDACKQYRKKLTPEWKLSVDYRRGKPFATESDDDRVAVNLDWSLTKQKQASLFSQIPAVRVNHPPQSISKEALPWLHAYEQKINDTLLIAGIEAAMDESLPDCINASGIGIIMAYHESLTEDVEVPAIDIGTFPPEIAASIQESGFMPDGTPVPMNTVPRVIDHRYVTTRLSPSDFLWPLSFTGSDFNVAPWIGRTGRASWAVAQKRWNLDPRNKNKHVGLERNLEDRISSDSERDRDIGEEMVEFDELFYHEAEYSPDARIYAAIHHLVYVNGLDEPVVDEQWKGQQLDPQSNQLIGCLRYPICTLTLSYITDEAIPPSDSAIGRSQVNELNKGRTQMIRQREHSFPINWFDVNRIDPAIQYSLMRGTWQGYIPVQGNGDNVIGSVTRNAMPPDNFTFDRIAKLDLMELWQVGQEIGGNDVETRGEADIIASNVSTRIGRERAKVGKFFTNIAEVIGGLICVYEDPASIGEGFRPEVSKTLIYSILADSTLLLDSNQRIKRLMDFINFTAKSGWLNIEPVLKEIATLHGLDPAIVIQPPQPKSPAEPNMSLRLTGIEDLMNPLALAFLMKSGQAPDSKLIEEAKNLIVAAVMPPPAPDMGPNGEPPILPEQQTSEPPPPDIGADNPNWSAMPRINKRVVERDA